MLLELLGAVGLHDAFFAAGQMPGDTDAAIGHRASNHALAIFSYVDGAVTVDRRDADRAVHAGRQRQVVSQRVGVFQAARTDLLAKVLQSPLGQIAGRLVSAGGEAFQRRMGQLSRLFIGRNGQTFEDIDRAAGDLASAGEGRLFDRGDSLFAQVGQLFGRLLPFGKLVGIELPDPAADLPISFRLAPFRRCSGKTGGKRQHAQQGSNSQSRQCLGRVHLVSIDAGPGNYLERQVKAGFPKYNPFGAATHENLYAALPRMVGPWEMKKTGPGSQR